MNIIKTIAIAAVAATLALGSASPLSAQTNKQRGVALGGIAGAIAGGLIGDHNDEAGAGAAIGGLVGAVAGGVMGDAADKEQSMARQYAAQRAAQRQYYAQQQHAAAMQSAVTVHDVVTMSTSGLSDQVIINQVRQRGFAQKLAVSDIIALHQQGVSENVITALQSAPAPSVPQAAPVAGPTTTVVEQHIHRPAPIVIEERVVPYYHPHHFRRGHYHRGVIYHHW